MLTCNPIASSPARRLFSGGSLVLIGILGGVMLESCMPVPA